MKSRASFVLLMSAGALVLAATFSQTAFNRASAQTPAAQTPAARSPAAPRPNSSDQPRVNIESRQKNKGPEDNMPRPDIRVDTNVVLIPVAVNDAYGRPVAGLSKEHFQITDNKIPQKITSFASDDAPVALGLIFDTSSSMSPSIAAARRAAALFVATANPGDQFLLVEFDSAPRLTIPLTADLAHINYELTFTQSRGQTAMLDGVYMALNEIKKSPLQRKALILVTDGEDNHSRYTVSELRKLLQESEVLIYSVGFVFSDTSSSAGLLKLISEQTGGRLFVANTGLPDIASKIGVDLRNRYLLGYVPNNYARDGLYHKVEVELKPPKGLPKLHAFWRKGYFAPTD